MHIAQSYSFPGRTMRPSSMMVQSVWEAPLTLGPAVGHLGEVWDLIWPDPFPHFQGRPSIFDFMKFSLERTMGVDSSTVQSAFRKVSLCQILRVKRYGNQNRTYTYTPMHAHTSTHAWQSPLLCRCILRKFYYIENETFVNLLIRFNQFEPEMVSLFGLRHLAKPKDTPSEHYYHFTSLLV